jgi:hypothetical protein
LSCDEWKALPDQLFLRYIKTHYDDRTGQKRTLIIVTTLLDTAKYPVEELTSPPATNRSSSTVESRVARQATAMD